MTLPELGDIIIQPASVISTTPEHHLINVKWIGFEGKVSNVVVLNDPGNFSFPRYGDIVLVLEVRGNAYCLGKIEYDYKNKIAGMPDPTTKKKIKAKKVLDGETWIGSLLTRTWLYIANSGNFSLANGLTDGFKYYKQSRFLRIGSATISLIGHGLNGAFGSVMRDIPGKGRTPIPSDFPLVPSIEALIDLTHNMIKLARFHIGHVMDTTLGIPEVGSYGGRLRALLQTYNAVGVPAAKLAFDELGNVELVSSLTNLMLNATALIQLGGLSAAEPVIKGLSYISAEKVFLASLKTYCDTIAGAGLTHAAAIPPTPISNGAFISVLVTATGLLSSAVTAFSGALDGTLSVKTMTV